MVNVELGQGMVFFNSCSKWSMWCLVNSPQYGQCRTLSSLPSMVIVKLNQVSPIWSIWSLVKSLQYGQCWTWPTLKCGTWSTLQYDQCGTWSTPQYGQCEAWSSLQCKAWSTLLDVVNVELVRDWELSTLTMFIWNQRVLLLFPKFMWGNELNVSLGLLVLMQAWPENACFYHPKFIWCWPRSRYFDDIFSHNSESSCDSSWSAVTTHLQWVHHFIGGSRVLHYLATELFISPKA